ncbi:FCD domain-containing protein [Alkalihalobacillus oceani]|uniref:FCD domain-containing protein n=1 Tax=Halalkalibacter oceani TaxID=1653776 RepID=UPI002042209E|nr:FCD domain-containing protein [Halalkalibacter oceani]MCM3760443.1 FCD domain-containing protein [Halalkalibacter oceani]
MVNFNDEVNLLEMNVFSKKEEAAQYLLLKYLLHSEEPVGSWVLKVMLELKGIEVSVATVGRYLKNLDSKKFTTLEGSQGRVITSQGAAYVKELAREVEREHLQKQLMEAAQPQNFEELLDLLRTRKVLECESARLAAERADENDLKAIELSMQKHESCVGANNDPTSPALDFHRKVTLASKNRFLIASLDILIYEELKLESQIVDLISRERGEEYGYQHREIAKAIINKDPEKAGELMNLHLSEIIHAIEEQYRSKKIVEDKGAYNK